MKLTADVWLAWENKWEFRCEVLLGKFLKFKSEHGKVDFFSFPKRGWNFSFFSRLLFLLWTIFGSKQKVSSNYIFSVPGKINSDGIRMKKAFWESEKKAKFLHVCSTLDVSHVQGCAEQNNAIIKTITFDPKTVMSTENCCSFYKHFPIDFCRSISETFETCELW